MPFIEFPEDFIDDSKFFPKLGSLAECLTAELEKAGGPGFCYSGMMIGQQNQPLGLVDQSRGLGVAWVRPVMAYPSTTFPVQDEPSAGTRCNGKTAMEVEIGVARCAPRAAGKDMYPDPQHVFEAMRLYMADLAAVKRAVLCCFPEKEPKALVAIGAWQPLEAAGGISGGTWQAWIG